MDELTKIGINLFKKNKFSNKPVEINGRRNNEQYGKLDKALENERKVEIYKPTSFRTKYSSRDNPNEKGVDIGLNAAEHHKKGEKSSSYEIASTAVQRMEFNPETNDCKVTFTSNPKKYNYKMSSDEFEQFYRAPSKGKYVNEVMKTNNHDPNYP